MQRYPINVMHELVKVLFFVCIFLCPCRGFEVTSPVSNLPPTPVFVFRNSPYKIFCTITSHRNDIVTIEPGVTLIFYNQSEFNIQGNLTACNNCCRIATGDRKQNSLHFFACCRKFDLGWIAVFPTWGNWLT